MFRVQDENKGKGGENMKHVRCVGAAVCVCVFFFFQICV